MTDHPNSPAIDARKALEELREWTLAGGCADRTAALMARVDAVLATHASPPTGPVTVQRIECVPITHPFPDEDGRTEADPIWRVEIDGYCADFEFEQAARNFVAAINRRLASSPPVITEEMAGVQSPREAVATASLVTSRLIAKVIRDTAAEMRAESEDAADGMLGIAEGLEEKMVGWAHDLAANYALAAALSSAPPIGETGDV